MLIGLVVRSTKRLISTNRFRMNYTMKRSRKRMKRKSKKVRKKKSHLVRESKRK